MPIIPLNKRINTSLKLDCKFKVNITGENITNAIIFFIIFICAAEKYLVCFLH